MAALEPSAAERWAAIDFGPGDYPSVLELFPDLAARFFPEPDEEILNVELAAQLWWPALGPPPQLP